MEPDPMLVDEILPGGLVEMTDPLVAADEVLMRKYLKLGGQRPTGSVNGRDYFGVSIGEQARVLRRKGAILEVRFLGGNWKDRSGWVRIGSVRIPPSEIKATFDVKDGRDLIARRQVYAAIHAAKIAATAEAEASRPFHGMPTDAAAIREFLEERRGVYEAATERRMADLQSRSGLDAEQLVRIEAEGDRERWPSWDGLADDQGPIPTFGPAQTDASGRIIMDEPERNARRSAVIRALTAIGLITDATDTDEVWSKAAARFEGAH